MLEGAKVKTLRPSMNELRVFKSGAEIANLRKAGKASGRAFTEAMKHRFEGERQLDSYLQYGFKRQGCEESAFVPVVAGGKNALSIHYVRNDDALRDGEMNLVDGGGVSRSSRSTCALADDHRNTEGTLPTSHGHGPSTASSLVRRRISTKPF